MSDPTTSTEVVMTIGAGQNFKLTFYDSPPYEIGEATGNTAIENARLFVDIVKRDEYEIVERTTTVDRSITLGGVDDDPFKRKTGKF